MKDKKENLKNEGIQRATKMETVQAAIDDASDTALLEWEKQLQEREVQLDSRSRDVKRREDDVKKREEVCSGIEKDRKRLDELLEKNKGKASELRDREAAVQEKEMQLAHEAADKLAEEIAARRQKAHEKLDEEIEDERKRRLDAIEKESKHRHESLDKEIRDERTRRMAAIEEESKQRHEALNAEIKAKLEEVDKERKTLKDEKELREELAKAKAEFEVSKQALESEKQKIADRIEYEKQKIEETIDAAVSQRFAGRDKELEARRKADEDTIANLQQALTESEKRNGTIEKAKLVYGDIPTMEKMIDDLKDANKHLKDKMSEMCSSEVKDERDRYKAVAEELGTDLSNMYQKIEEAQNLKSANGYLQGQLDSQIEINESLNFQLSEAKGRNKDYIEQIKRLTGESVDPADREKRMDSIKQAYLENPFHADVMTKEDAQQYDELEWLNNVEQMCDEYGVHFPRRILHAFHTSLKIANWSTITVLAGVSGTGKSELPRLYSAFGGLNFINVPVQPNWDSQESMLGFFNSIDNKFDAQPMLRFLYQCTHDLSSNMAIVLLDEMNLAHVEHYFADFLSKLELRRGYATRAVPNIDVNLGAGVAPYELPLLRNILYCGTMNQDETTKSLSDKVLDRGIVINFPRPRHLIDRDGARSITNFCKKKEMEGNAIMPLSHTVWKSWEEKKIQFVDQQRNELNKYRTMLEKINEYLANTGRAIGHRVWQSVAQYVMNYPDVRKAFYEAQGELTDQLRDAMHIAVEDQLVQKMMPKLRGIDTTGNSSDNCLDPIRKELSKQGFNLDKDFERALKMGYGQFMWCSAEYIDDEDKK